MEKFVGHFRNELYLPTEVGQRPASFGSSIELVKEQENSIKSTKIEMQNLLSKNASIRNIILVQQFNFEYNYISESMDIKLIFNSFEFENTAHTLNH